MQSGLPARLPTKLSTNLVYVNYDTNLLTYIAGSVEKTIINHGATVRERLINRFGYAELSA